MTGRNDPDYCGIGWCEEIHDHEGPHRKRLYDTFAMDVAAGKSTVLQLWLQGESARVRACVLVTGMCETGLTWQQTRALGSKLADTERRYG